MRRATAAQILDAADELLGQRGYAGTSVRAVAEHAKVGKGLVFYHFESKAKLVEAVLERYYQGHLAALEQAFAEAGSPRLRFHRVVDAYLDYIVAHAGFPRLVQQVLAADDERAAAMVERGLAPMFAWLEDALSGVSPPAPSPLSSRQIYVTFQHAVIGYFSQAPQLAALWGEDPLAPEAVEVRRAHLHWLLDLLLDGLEAASP